MYGNAIGYNVILEGILAKKNYGNMLSVLIANFQGAAYVFYLDISFEETLKRHATKPNAHEFGEKEMRQWWNEKDYLNVIDEYSFTDSLDQQQIVEYISNIIS